MIHDPAILSVFWGVYGIHTYIHEKLYVLARLKGDIRLYVYTFLAKIQRESAIRPFYTRGNFLTEFRKRKRVFVD